MRNHQWHGDMKFVSWESHFELNHPVTSPRPGRCKIFFGTQILCRRQLRILSFMNMHLFRFLAWTPAHVPKRHSTIAAIPSTDPLNRPLWASKSMPQKPFKAATMETSGPSPAKERASIEKRMARKFFAKQLILDELPHIVERGWGALVQWPERSLFAPDVTFEFPFLDYSWMRENVSVQTPSPNLLILNYDIVADAQSDSGKKKRLTGPVPSSSVHVRTRIGFDDNGDIDAWFENWSQTQAEFCRNVLELTQDFVDSDEERRGEIMVKEGGKSFAEFTDNSYLENNPLAKEALKRQMERLIEFLSVGLPQLSLLGSSKTNEKMEELYSYYADDVEIDTPIGELYGRLALELVFPLSRVIAKMFFKTLAMELQSVQQPGDRILSCTYVTRAVSRLGGVIAFTTRSVFYIDKMGKIAKQTDTYSVDPFMIATSHFRKRWWSL